MSNATDVVAGVKKLEQARKDCIAALKEKEVEVAENMKWSELAGYIEKVGGGVDSPIILHWLFDALDEIQENPIITGQNYSETKTFNDSEEFSQEYAKKNFGWNDSKYEEYISLTIQYGMSGSIGVIKFNLPRAGIYHLKWITRSFSIDKDETFTNEKENYLYGSYGEFIN